jgi:hypothetical protein
MLERLHCQAHDIRDRIVQQGDDVIEFTHEVEVQPHAMRTEVRQHPMHSQDFIVLQLGIFELLKREPQGLCLW